MNSERSIRHATVAILRMSINICVVSTMIYSQWSGCDWIATDERIDSRIVFIG
ncbi:MAG: hypothetical protein ACTMIA_08910 [Vibrio sp.]